RSRLLALALLANDFVSLYWLSLKILIEPIDDVLQSLDAMPVLVRAREFVRFLGEAHHHHRLLEKFQGPKHSLAARRRRSAIVHLALDEHEWRLYLVDLSNWRARCVIGGILPGSGFEPVRLKQREIGAVPPRRPVADRALRYRGCKT